MSTTLLIRQFLPAFLLTLFTVSFASGQCFEPTNVQADAVRATSADISWTASTSEPGIGYDYEVRTFGAPGSGIDPEDGYVTSGNTVDGLLTTTIQNLDISTDYFFYIRYECATLDFSPWTLATTFSTTTVQPPVAIAAIYMSDDSFLARWNPSEGATGYYLDVSTDIGFTTFVSGYEDLFVPINSKNVTGLTPSTTYYYRVRAANAGPTTANSNIITVSTIAAPLDFVVWTEAGWSGDPAYDLDAIIDWDYNTAEDGDFVALTLTINSGYTLTINEFGSVGVENEITNNGGLILENNGNLVQVNDAAPANTGEMTVIRDSSPIFRQDYTMWSSPVTGAQTLKNFSPLTLDTRFYTYDESTDFFAQTNPNLPFEQGAGYLIRVRNTHVNYVDETSVPQIWTGTFTGVPGNGLVEVPLSLDGQGFNMVGNPYPSVISAQNLFEFNLDNIESTLYFWRRRNSTTEGDLNSYYATYTELGGTASDTSEVPNGFIQIGQGFLVQAKAGGGPLVFTNEERVSDNFENQFFRASNIVDKSRMWLNLTNANGAFSQMLVGYMDGASNEIDRADGKYINDGSVALTSYLGEKEYVIQARALPFSESDMIPLHFKTSVPGDFTISLPQLDGLFEDLEHIYLRDNYSNTFHDLKTGNYTFAATVGTFTDRFEIVYNNQLGVENPVTGNAVAAYAHNGIISVHSGNQEIGQVSVFDLRGRKIYQSGTVNASEFDITGLRQDTQMLIVRILTNDNQVVTKKIIF